jgi:hypothetical protein
MKYSISSRNTLLIGNVEDVENYIGIEIEPGDLLLVKYKDATQVVEICDGKIKTYPASEGMKRGRPYPPIENPE